MGHLVAVAVVALVISLAAVLVSIAVWRANVRSALATEADAEASRQAVGLTRLQMRQSQMPVVIPAVDTGTDEEAVRPRIGSHMVGGRYRSSCLCERWGRGRLRYTSRPSVRRR